jgi:hypothetical protein
MTTCNPDIIPMQQVNPPATDWWSWVARQGIFAAMLVLFAGWFGTAIVVPMRDDQRAFMQSVIKTNELNAATVSKQTEIQQTQAQALKDIVPVLQQIRDDQRRGVWLENAAGKGM